MGNWSLTELLASLHEDLQQRLTTARRALSHPGAKGDASEKVWLELLERYLPHRYRVASAHVVDCEGSFSEQIDVVVFDRQYSPFIFEHAGQKIIPAESVYAVFEAKQAIDAAVIEYAQAKVTTVRALHRTSLPIPSAGGTLPAKTLTPILGGIVALESDWSPPLGSPMQAALARDVGAGRLDLGCIAAHGIFHVNSDGSYAVAAEGKPATAFLFELIARLQAVATVPMIDIRAYGRWLL